MTTKPPHFFSFSSLLPIQGAYNQLLDFSLWLANSRKGTFGVPRMMSGPASESLPQKHRFSAKKPTATKQTRKPSRSPYFTRTTTFRSGCAGSFTTCPPFITNAT